MSYLLFNMTNIYCSYKAHKAKQLPAVYVQKYALYHAVLCRTHYKCISARF